MSRPQKCNCIIVTMIETHQEIVNYKFTDTVGTEMTKFSTKNTKTRRHSLKYPLN